MEGERQKAQNKNNFKNWILMYSSLPEHVCQISWKCIVFSRDPSLITTEFAIMLLEYFPKKNIAVVHRVKELKFSSWEICAQKLQHTSADMLETLDIQGGEDCRVGEGFLQRNLNCHSSNGSPVSFIRLILLDLSFSCKYICAHTPHCP